MKNSNEHYAELLKRIAVKEEFSREMTGKLCAVIDSGYPLGITKAQVPEIVTILRLNTIGEPQIWPEVK